MPSIWKWVSLGLVAATAVAYIAVFILFLMLRNADERLGAAESQLKTAVDANKGKSDATQGRARIEQRVRQLPPGDKLNKL